MMASNRRWAPCRRHTKSPLFGRPLSAMALLICLGGDLSFQAKGELPTAEAVLDRYVEVTGGRKAYEELVSRVSTGNTEFTSLEIRGRTTIYQSKPVRHYSLTESEAFGIMEEGTDGNLAWANSLLAGPRLKKGPERAYALRQAPLDAAMRWREHYEKVVFQGKETIDGVPCFKILLTPKEGRPETRFYREDSGLLVRTELLLDSESGPLPAAILTSDYKPVDGFLIPHTTRHIIAGGFLEMCLTLEGVEHDRHIADSRFALPEDVRALVDKEKLEKKKQPGQKTK